MNPEVEACITESERWSDEMTGLHAILADCGLTEVIKWRSPCYMHEGRNIAIMQEMKEFLALMFFKGALIDDVHGVLKSQGPNSRSAMRLEFRSVDDVALQRSAVEAYVAGAVALADEGVTVDPPGELVVVEELQLRLDEDAVLMAAFGALTPGRQREYNLYVSGAKQATTRAARVEKHVERILAGKGLRDRWSPSD